MVQMTAAVAGSCAYVGAGRQTDRQQAGCTREKSHPPIWLSAKLRPAAAGDSEATQSLSAATVSPLPKRRCAREPSGRRTATRSAEASPSAGSAGTRAAAAAWACNVCECGREGCVSGAGALRQADCHAQRRGVAVSRLSWHTRCRRGLGLRLLRQRKTQ